MDMAGKALTPIITHQDRRSVEIARDIEQRLGKRRHLQLTGNRPFPGGISSTTWAWFLQHQPQVLRKADLVGGHARHLADRLLEAERPVLTHVMGEVMDVAGVPERVAELMEGASNG